MLVDIRTEFSVITASWSPFRGSRSTDHDRSKSSTDVTGTFISGTRRRSGLQVRLTALKWKPLKKSTDEYRNTTERPCFVAVRNYRQPS